MEAGLLSAILGLVTVQGETAMLDLDLQKVAFLSDVGRSSDSGPGPSNPQPIPEQIQQGPQDPPGSARTEQVAEGPRNHPGQPSP